MDETEQEKLEDFYREDFERDVQKEFQTEVDAMNADSQHADDVANIKRDPNAEIYEQAKDDESIEGDFEV